MVLHFDQHFYMQFLPLGNIHQTIPVSVFRCTHDYHLMFQVAVQTRIEKAFSYFHVLVAQLIKISGSSFNVCKRLLTQWQQHDPCRFVSTQELEKGHNQAYNLLSKKLAFTSGDIHRYYCLCNQVELNHDSYQLIEHNSLTQ